MTFDGLEKNDAFRRAAEVVVTVHAQGFAAAHGLARQLAKELRIWSEATLELPELQPALLAYRADPLPVNQLRPTR
jgi:hypothetical protein